MKLHNSEIQDRNVIKWDKRNEVWNNGIDNAYPTLIEKLVNASVTAKSCAGVWAKFLYCNGFEFEYELREQARLNKTRFDRKALVVNKKGDTPSRLLRRLAKKSLSVQRGAWIHVNYNALYQVSSVDIIPYKHPRFDKEDSEEYKGKVQVYNNWDKSKGSRIQKSKFKAINIYNPNPKVIQKQVEAAGGWKKYNGQVYFVNLDEGGTYPLAWIDAVVLDCDSEAQASIYKNRGLRKGFFGKHVIGVKPFESDDDYDDFEEELKGFTGAENADSVVVVEIENKKGKLEEEFFMKPIERNSEDGFFSHTEKSSANNIRKAYGNVPPVLIDYVEGKLGGTSGEEFEQAQRFYQRQLEEERNDVEEVFEEIFSNFHKAINPMGNWNIKLFIEENQQDNGTTDK